MENEDYTCELCGETYQKTRPDKEALAESHKNFGKHPPQDLSIICDDCFQKIRPDKFPLAVKIAKARAAKNGTDVSKNL